MNSGDEETPFYVCLGTGCVYQERVNGRYHETDEFKFIEFHFKFASEELYELYSNYNFHTLTGRPSNTFGNINFSAIEKFTGVRKSFIPRNDHFILFDYDSFHLNLVAKIIQYKFDEDNLHTYLGKYYYNKSTLTDEEYSETKKRNFKYLYGGIPKEIKDKIPFFASVQTFVFSMWREIKSKGYYLSPLTTRKIFLSTISNPSATKVFNYFIQLIETETNLVIIQRLENYLKDKKTKLVLYTYDSFLFDVDKSDGKDVIKNITKILNVFPMKTYFGNNYDDMVDVTHNFKEKIKE